MHHLPMHAQNIKRSALVATSFVDTPGLRLLDKSSSVISPSEHELHEKALTVYDIPVLLKGGIADFQRKTTQC